MGRMGYLYYRHDGVSHRMPDDPASAEFATEYARLRSGRAVPTAKRNVKKLIDSYLASPKWDRLALNTQKSYRRSFNYLEEKIGQYDPASIKPHHVYDMRDGMKDKPTTAKRRVAALSVLMQHAIKLGWIASNPVHARFEHLPTNRPARQPWPLDLIQDARDAANPETLLIFEMLLGTGQRISDVLAMQWGHIEDDGIWVTQSKTKARLFVPFTDRLRDMLEATPRKGLHIITLPDGRPMKYNSAYSRMMELRKAIGAEAYDNHALRHAAASEIAALPDMTEEHVKAITGHTSAGMVYRYSGPAGQKARAIEAQKARK
ncbi:tyrosine-type recombinase/integrase [Pseudosulfitobacter pseudonitzschiae]|nr:tyrosine-type recombinase/integrase [Pseudosulfitobacter pseudonitzschiae]MCD2353630.1 tyrosine-type recombinase/integrase [Pseudosulfitobacter pseudonitzschiae]UFE41227.1 tyrosine-type recombinase/integrase [Pseudosulfitobacter pseudonitzschiae]UFE71172.1 tyrosine-type recombinase/integrase [Pseudosulfitobacter pseudonitzschiae]UFE84779.1 tyrosine-type recombinase/integrase [Pseudosulfitobacter pseudonitzschiae]UFE91682.1 tyrosine-type recombinase/integrase [Pseudosulfitobacter pseudonitzs